MAGLESGVSDESGPGSNNSSNNFKNKDNSFSSYFLTELPVTKKGGDNSHKGPGRYFNDQPSTSGRKVFVNVSAHGTDKTTEVAFASNLLSRKTVDSRSQSDRNIVGQEESPPKERKKWVRPPVVGQAASIDSPLLPSSNQHTSSDSELEKKKTPSFHLSLGKTTSYFDTGTQKGVYDKDSDDFHKDEIPGTPENADCPRVPSPASISSLTSRPLEWDSGADVGYNNVFSIDPNDQRLSTIEKLALVQGTSNIFKRSDPEGTTGNNNIVPNPVTVKIAAPVAESTPKNIDKNISDSDGEYSRKPTCKKEKNNHPLFPEVVVKAIGVASDSSASPEFPHRSDTNRQKEESDNLKKLSASLEEMGARNTADQIENFPRSHSQNNILEESNFKGTAQRFIDSAKSRSSSSVSTVVNKRGSERNPVYSKTNYESPVNRDSDENQNNCDNQIEQNVREDIPSRHTSPQGTDQFNTLESGLLIAEARVNSFEYLPGHVYENSVAIVDSDSSSQQSNGIWNAIGNDTTLKEDIERGANLMAEFIRSSKVGEDNALKKQFVRRVVEKLINKEYRDDVSIKSDRSVNRNDNMMMGCRGQISGESSTEKSDANQPDQQLPHKINKCVGTGNFFLFI